MSRVVLFTKPEPSCYQAVELAHHFFRGEVDVFVAGGAFPREALDVNYEIVLSYLSPWVVPAGLLESARLALNWHPGSTDYPGIGCYNFALYEGAKIYGATCHHMAPAVDSGEVVLERLFSVGSEETVASLRMRTLITMLSMFHEVLETITSGQDLPVSSRQWSRAAFTRKQLEDLRRITAEMDASEIERRVRAMSYPGYPGAEVILAGHVFEVRTPNDVI